MKYLIVIPDGSADDPIDSMGGKTPLEAADIPVMDMLASKGEIGTVKTVPEGISPGSDSANLSVMGYDPRIYLTGRSPLEAAAIGVDMSSTDISFRANFITIDPAGEAEYEDYIVRDHAAGDITTEECEELLKDINAAFADENLYFYTGTGYRHCMLLHKEHPHAHTRYKCVPPHDILDKHAREYLPKGESADFLIDMMKKSYDILKDHPINKARIARGLNPANSLWIWGQGTRPNLPNFCEKFGVKATVISAVDLIRGIGYFAGINVVTVEGADGTINTNYEGKVAMAISEYERGQDMIYMHIEGTDECSHQGNLEAKMRCAHYIDSRVVKPLYEYLESTGEDYKILVVPDHRTPLAIRTHSSDPVPFLIYDSRNVLPADPKKQFNERAGYEANNYIHEGSTLADRFFERIPASN